MEATLQGIFRGDMEAIRKEHGVSMDQHQAAQAIMDCQSEVLGYELGLPRTMVMKRRNHSCRHRSCPRCHGQSVTIGWKRAMPAYCPAIITTSFSHCRMN